LIFWLLTLEEMKKGLSKYKFERLAVESLRNALRLHFDSALLYTHHSYPSAFQLSILALEEFSKAKWVEHYYFSSITNSGFPDEKFEQGWLQLLYIHPEKQTAFFAGEMFDYSPPFFDFVRKRGLETKKQRATYVGFDRSKARINTASRLSTPGRIKQKDAKQMISLLNSEFLEIHQRISAEEGYFSIDEMDGVISNQMAALLKKWPHKTNLKSRRWWTSWDKKLSSANPPLNRTRATTARAG